MYKKGETEYINQIHNVITEFEKVNIISLSQNPHMQMLIEAFACLNSDLKNILQTQQHHFITQILELFYPNFNKIITHILIMQLQNDKEAAQSSQE